MPKFLNALLVVAITLAAGSCPLFSAEKRTYHCYTISAPPRVDGLLDDEAWKSLPASNSFTILSTNEYAAKQTHIQLGWDRDHLYIGVRCDEPEMKLLSANMRDGDAIWGEDSIEIFFQPESGLGFYQFAVNSKGAKTGVERADGLTGFEAKGFHGPDFYSLEISMPFALFGKAAIPGAVWRGNIDRNIWAGGKVFTCWAPLQGSFHDTDNFGRFVFELSAAAEQSTTWSRNAANTRPTSSAGATFLHTGRRRRSFRSASRSSRRFRPP
jgi:hypothetical protein